MQFKTNDCTVLATAIREKNLTKSSRDLLVQMLGHGNGFNLVTELLNQERVNSRTIENSVSHVLSSLEALEQTDQLIGRCLMADLWPIASKHLLHEVCDAISLWIVDRPTVQLARYIKLMRTNEQDAEIRRIYDGWLSNFPHVE